MSFSTLLAAETAAQTSCRAVARRFFSRGTAPVHAAMVTARPTGPGKNCRSTVKPLGSRKTFLIDQYHDLMVKNQMAVFVHYNNLLKQEDHFYRNQIRLAGGTLTKIRNNLFQVYLRNSDREDPCAPPPPAPSEPSSASTAEQHPLAPLLVGPTALITFRDTDPRAIAKLVKLLASASDKLFILGAKLDTSYVDLREIKQFSKLPAKPELQSTLVSILQSLSGAGLVNMLQRNSQSLYVTLHSHESQLSDDDPKT